MTNARHDAISIWNAGVDAVRARSLVSREIAVDEATLTIQDQSWLKQDFDRIIVVGAGKAGSAMALGAMDSIADWLPVVGWVNVPEGTIPTGADLRNVHLHPARPAGVNEPTEAAVDGTREILKLASNAGPSDLCLALISGGGSALLTLPITGVSLAEKREVTRRLSSAGADIVQLNTVRKHLSQIKGGGLKRASRAGALVTLILSDVLGDPLDVIASGPTVQDSSSPQDALDVLNHFDPDKQLPAAIYLALEERLASVTSSNASTDPTRATSTKMASNEPTSEDTVIVLGNNAVAVDEAGIRAESLGYNHAMQSARSCEGAAEDVGRHLAEMTIQMLRADPKKHRTDCLITGGEPTVVLAPESQRGRGGRNQQLVLAAYQRLCEEGLRSDEWQRLTILSGGTDGEDGPTDAAGAFIDAEVHAKVMALGLLPQDYLNRNDAYTFFQQTGGLLITGPTGTNVCDVRVALVSASN